MIRVLFFTSVAIIDARLDYSWKFLFLNQFALIHLHIHFSEINLKLKNEEMTFVLNKIIIDSLNFDMINLIRKMEF